MKRTVGGVILLLVLLAGGILSSILLSRHNIRVADQLDCAAAQATEEDLSGAIRTAEEARTAWGRSRDISAAFIDHNPLEQIDGGFARLRLYGEGGDSLAFAAVCVELAGQLRAIGDAHGVQWWNIL